MANECPLCGYEIPIGARFCSKCCFSVEGIPEEEKDRIAEGMIKLAKSLRTYYGGFSEEELEKWK